MSQIDVIYDVKESEKVASGLSLSKKRALSESLADFKEGIKRWQFWWSMAVAELKRRYRRTMLGPFWTSLSLGIFIISVGTVFSLLWKQDIPNYLPYFTSGYICWIFISSLIVDSCATFIAAESLLKQLALPYSAFAWLVVSRNVLVLAHHAIVYILVASVLQVSLTLNTLLILPALVLLCLTGFWVSIIIGLICARYRDMQQVIASILQISLFLTPIFWSADQFKGGTMGMVININPLYHYISILRAPMLGQAPDLFSWCMAICFTIAGGYVALYMFSRYQRKLVFWL